MGVADQFKRFTLRLPEEIHDQLLQVARKNHRSLNSEMIFIFQTYIEKEVKNKVGDKKK